MAELEAWLVQVVASYGVLAMDAATFREWARLKHRKSDTLIEDAMIAATARVHGLTIATRNASDFRDFGVDLFDPFEQEFLKATVDRSDQNAEDLGGASDD